MTTSNTPRDTSSSGAHDEQPSTDSAMPSREVSSPHASGGDTSGTPAEPQTLMPVSQPVFLRALKWSIAATLLMVIVFGAIGYLVSDERGLIGGILGAAGAGIFFALTLGSIAFANRFAGSDLFVALFFGIVVGGWLLKFVIFIVAALLLKHQPWLDPQILFISVIVGVIVSLVIDSVIVFKSRIPIISS